MKNDLIEQEKMQNVIDNVEKIIKTNGFMAVKENKVLEELYTKVKNSDLKELISKKEKIKDCFFRGRLFNEGEKEKKIKEEGNEDNEFLSFVQPPLIKKMSSARFNHINNSYFYISDNKYGPYFEMEKYKKENKKKELFVQKFKLKEVELKLLDTDKIDNFLTKKLSVATNLVENRNNHVLSDNYNVSNFFIDLFKSNKRTLFNGILYDNKKIFDSFLKSKNFFIPEVKVRNKTLFYNNITFFSDYWNYYDIKLEDLFTNKTDDIKDDNEINKLKNSKISELTGKTKEHCIQASEYFEAIGQPERISVEEVIIEVFKELVLKKSIAYYDLVLKVTIECNIEKLIDSKKINIDDFFKLKLDYPELESETTEEEFLKFEWKIFSKYEIRFIRKENDIKFENKKEAKKILLNYIKEIFNLFFEIYYKLDIDEGEIYLINQ